MPLDAIVEGAAGAVGGRDGADADGADTDGEGAAALASVVIAKFIFASGTTLMSEKNLPMASPPLASTLRSSRSLPPLARNKMA